MILNHKTLFKQPILEVQRCQLLFLTKQNKEFQNRGPKDILRVYYEL
jgi:hypothetical protein